MTSQYLPPDAQAETVAAPVENSAQPVQSAAAQACCCSSEICRSQGCQIVAAAAGNVQNASPSALTPDPLLVQAVNAIRRLTRALEHHQGTTVFQVGMEQARAILAQAKERGL